MSKNDKKGSYSTKTLNGVSELANRMSILMLSKNKTHVNPFDTFPGIALGGIWVGFPRDILQDAGVEVTGLYIVHIDDVKTGRPGMHKEWTSGGCCF